MNIYMNVLCAPDTLVLDTPYTYIVICRIYICSLKFLLPDSRHTAVREAGGPVTGPP